MQWTGIQRLIGLLLSAFGLTMLPPIAASLIYGDGEAGHFASTLALTTVSGLLLWLPVRRIRTELRVRDGFIIVALFWSVMSIFSAIPFLFSPRLDFSHAVFEAVSGFTTTGATVISGLDGLPPSILYYRQQLQWLGGMGIIVLAVAVLPMLGVGGMQLYRAETPGPMKHEKLTPRIADTARILWTIYLGLTVACALAYWGAGMSLFDAIGHSFSTVATGGFSTHDASMGHFDSPLIEAIAIVFMLLGGISFALHFRAFRHARLRDYWRDAEALGFLCFVAAAVLVIAVLLGTERAFGAPLEALRYAAFQVVSVITTTGYTTTDFSLWPSFVPVMLIYLSFVGGCAGSTAGGMKVVRVLLLIKQMYREVLLLVHPRSVIAVRLGLKPLPEQVLNAVWGFTAIYAFSTALITMLFIAAGLDTLSAFGATAATLNLLGPGLGEVATSFATVSDAALWVAIFAMLLGRLEIFTLFVLLTPAFWRR